MSSRFAQRGGWWVVGQLLLMLAVFVLGITCRAETKNFLVVICGWFFLAVAAVCGSAGWACLGRNLTPFPKPSAKTQLVQHGIYRRVRHPLYTAVICAAFGWSLTWESWSAVAGSLVLAIYFDAKARREEIWLRQQFPDYANYEKHVDKFIPWIY